MLENGSNGSVKVTPKEIYQKLVGLEQRVTKVSGQLDNICEQRDYEQEKKKRDKQQLRENTEDIREMKVHIKILWGLVLVLLGAILQQFITEGFKNDLVKGVIMLCQKIIP